MDNLNTYLKAVEDEQEIIDYNQDETSEDDNFFNTDRHMNQEQPQ